MVDNTHNEQPKGGASCTIVEGSGTDEQIAARCAEKVDGWDSLGAAEQSELVQLQRRYWEMQQAPDYKAGRSATGNLELEPQGNQTLNVLRLMDAMGTTELSLIDARISDVVRYRSSTCESDQKTSDFMAACAFISGGNAEDPQQAALLTQMQATHDAAMRALTMIGRAGFTDQVQLYGNLSNKLLNTYARQAETLRKLQKGGEQTVRHVHVDNRGGQAVFAEQVNQNGGRPSESELQAHEQYAESNASPAMLGYDPAWNGVPATSNEEQKAL